MLEALAPQVQPWPSICYLLWAGVSLDFGLFLCVKPRLPAVLTYRRLPRQQLKSLVLSAL